VDTVSVVEVHNSFDFGSSGELILNDGILIYDAPSSKGLLYAYGTLTFNNGLFECTNNGFVLNNTANNISGGTIRAGGSFIASIAGVFHPTGGEVELTGSGTGNYIQVTNGNYFNDLTINRTGTIQIYTGTSLDINGDYDPDAVSMNGNGNVSVNNNFGYCCRLLF
jgi:hypothetical protein